MLDIQGEDGVPQAGAPQAGVQDAIAAVERLLDGMGQAAVAVSGGVDSLTLATLAGRHLGPHAVMYHAVSPAVPSAATERVRELAGSHGWQLTVFDAGEFSSPDYRGNPVNRCFYCKSHLYGAIRRQTGRCILSGTNLDDLGEYRPGLIAAENHQVRHPFVEAGIGKAGIRAVAGALGLGEVADLPASPCLSSRIETGLWIEPGLLALVQAVEERLGRELSPRTVRCRVRAERVVVELDGPCLDRLEAGSRAALTAAIGELARTHGIDKPVAFAPYRVGSAFVHAPS